MSGVSGGSCGNGGAVRGGSRWLLPGRVFGARLGNGGCGWVVRLGRSERGAGFI